MCHLSVIECRSKKDGIEIFLSILHTTPAKRASGAGALFVCRKNKGEGYGPEGGICSVKEGYPSNKGRGCASNPGGWIARESLVIRRIVRL